MDVQPCPWMSLPLKIRYPRFRTDITFPRMFQCFKELNALQDNKKILWLPNPKSGSLLQPVALGGSHGFQNDNDLDIWLLTTLDLGAHEHCSTTAVDNNFFQRVVLLILYSNNKTNFRPMKLILNLENWHCKLRIEIFFEF